MKYLCPNCGEEVVRYPNGLYFCYKCDVIVDPHDCERVCEHC